MEQPKKTKQKITVKNAGDGNLNGDVMLTPEEIEINRSVTEQSTTEEFSKEAKEAYRVDMKDGKAEPINQGRTVQYGDRLKGLKTRVIGEDKSVLEEAEQGSDKEKEMLRKLKNQEADTNKRRQNNADVINYQTGERGDNRVYQDKLREQEYAKNQKDKKAVKVKVKK